MKEFELRMIEDMLVCLNGRRINYAILNSIESKYLQSSTLVDKETFNVFSKLTSYPHSSLGVSQIDEWMLMLEKRKLELLGEKHG